MRTSRSSYDVLGRELVCWPGEQGDVEIVACESVNWAAASAVGGGELEPLEADRRWTAPARIYGSAGQPRRRGVLVDPREYDRIP
jgi:hypothetical protein